MRQLVKTTHPIKEQLVRLDAWCSVVESRQTDNGPLVRNKDAWSKVVTNVRKHIALGCFVDKPLDNHYRIKSQSSSGRLDLAVSRGSGGNEGAHSVVNKAVGNRASHYTAQANTSTACFRLTVKSLQDRGLCSKTRHWFLWKVKQRAHLEQDVYKLARPRLKLPPMGGLRMPVHWKDISPLRPVCGIDGGKRALYIQLHCFNIAQLT